MPEPRQPRRSARDRLREHFLANLGRVMGHDELREVAGGITEWARRVRELRDTEGFRILTHNDRDALKPGEYILDDPKPQPRFASGISKETRALVLDRNGFTCMMCGAAAGEVHPDDPAGLRVRLQMGHVIDRSKGGSDTPENLRALCSLCNEGAQNATQMRPDRLQLLIAVRRASRADQIELLQWLKEKFPDQQA